MASMFLCHSGRRWPRRACVVVWGYKVLSWTEIARQPCKPCHRARFNIPTRLCVCSMFHVHGVVLLCRRLFFFFLLLLFLPFTQVLGSIVARCSPTFYSQPRTPSRKWFIGDAARPLDRHPCLTAAMDVRSIRSLSTGAGVRNKGPRTRPAWGPR